MKTKESIAKYNKEYFSRPEVIAKAKIRNTKYRLRRKMYKKTKKGKENENKYRRNRYGKIGFEIHLKERYNISIEEYNSILEKQNNLCAICKLLSKTKLNVDHCHNTGRIRGLLCGNCNRALGLFKDNIQYLYNAIEYLSK